MVAFLTLVSLSGCGMKKKAEQKTTEGLAETTIKEVGYGHVDIDGDKVTIKGEGDKKLTFGGAPWPTSELARSIPEFKKGKVESVLNDAGAIWITVESVEKADATTYFDTIRKEFTQKTSEMNANGMTSYNGQNDVGVSVALFYSDELLIIAVTEPRK